MDEKKVILVSLIILLIGFISYKFAPDLTGHSVGNQASLIFIDEDKVMEGGTIKVTIRPGSKGIINEGAYPTSPVYLDLYRVSSVGDGERTAYRLKVCNHNRCKNKVTTYFRVHSNIISDFSPTQRFYLRGIDGSTGNEIRAYFLVENNDKITYDAHR